MSGTDCESAAAVGRDLPASAYVGALACLPGIGPVGLTGLLSRHDPATAWALVLAGEEQRPQTTARARPGLRTPWAVAARRFDVAERWSALVRAGIGITYVGAPGYPAALREDPEAPAALFWRGDLAALDGQCVAIVGTRRCTHYGREIAFELGRDLAEVGVSVVSGLALGIDGAAHLGALAASASATAGSGPVGVAASGVDVPYPQRHADLWERVVAAGAVLSETAPGQPAQAWRFPARNRIIAGLAGAVVVVESRAGGGSMLTVAAALARGLPVLAVPGTIRSPASEGTIQLLAEGSQPVRHAGDVLDALGDLRPWPPATGPRRAGARVRQPSAGGDDGGGERGGARPAGGASASAGEGAGVGRPRLDGPSRRILAAVDWTPTPTGVVAARTGVPIGPLSTGLHHLEALGLVRDDGGWWIRIGRR